MEKNEHLIKSVNCSWRNYVAIDKKFVSPNGVYWINSLYKNNKLVFEGIEKTNADKTTKDLQKEILNYIGKL